MDNPRIELPPAPDTPALLELHVELDNAEPRIWRRLKVPGSLTLEQLHPVLQRAFGWFDMHLHRFMPVAERGPFFVTDLDEHEGITGTHESEVRLDQVLTSPGATLHYEYDFGDGWGHTLRLEDTTAVPAGGTVIRCVDGAGAGPPEDCGGIGYYNNIVAWLRDGGRLDRAEQFDVYDAAQLRDWLPPDFDPDRFEVQKIDAGLNRPLEADAAGPDNADLPDDLAELIGRLDPFGYRLVQQWLHELRSAPATEPSPDAIEQLTRPWSVVLDQIGDGVKLTSAGYLPPAVVNGIFTELDLGATWIGKGNREDLTPPVYDLREQTQQLGLLRKYRGRLVPTKAGLAAGADPLALWRQCARVLPVGRAAAERDAGWIVMLAMGAGVPVEEVPTRTRDVLHALGWRRADGGRLELRDVDRAAHPTLEVLRPRQWWRFDREPRNSDDAVLLARAALRRD